MTKEKNDIKANKRARARMLMQAYSVLTTRISRFASLGYQYGTDRDLYQALGYINSPDYDNYTTKYLRQDIAAAIIDRPVEATWQGDFKIVDGADDQETKLEKDFNSLYKRLGLNSVFVRLDKLTGLGKYGVLLLGLNDVQGEGDFEKPVVPGRNELLYLKPFGEGNAIIQEYEKNPNDERYGKPRIYTVNIQDVYGGTARGVRVHHSRIIHVVDGLLESDVEGRPRLEVVFNRLMDLEKIVGGSAEMFWRGARPGYQAVAKDDAAFTDEELDELEDQFDEYEHNMRRILALVGVEMKALVAQVASPAQHVDVQFQMLASVTGIPKKILTGSERGELQSTQDKEAWLEYTAGRRDKFATPRIVRPFVDRGIEQGWLAAASNPEEGYGVQFEDLWSQSDEDKGNYAKIVAQALKEYNTNPGAKEDIPLEAFLEYILKLDRETIDVIREMREAEMEEERRQMEEDRKALEEERKRLEAERNPPPQPLAPGQPPQPPGTAGPPEEG